MHSNGLDCRKSSPSLDEALVRVVCRLFGGSADTSQVVVVSTVALASRGGLQGVNMDGN